MIKNYRIQVLGTVQGVWFRKYTKEAAIGYNLTGLVKNEADGSVFVIAEGQEPDLQSFIEWLHRGSPMSNVHKVLFEEGDLEGFRDFQISR